MMIFWLALKLGFELDIFVTASLVHVYTRFRALSYALKLFDDMPVRDMVSWNAMIFGSCQNGNATEALDVLNKMRLEGIMMDLITISKHSSYLCTIRLYFYWNIDCCICY
ncbi:hypothetical protein ERO13_D05G089166v2 [Gossypium hirsutum]|uniref:Pentatricopeptide repeat-containing protein n=2 Tax=Gossypium TaxID=3633 RepID=A0A5D2KSR3_GOSTO|nr:hypothetical protein ERO13_D05G089166v2 [Gossypium hirsutum]TYG67672.1 hypothetical protein ES288_D05G094300v1 [Gossypium darwinii]TYH70107.1 hypothetical protein ES332_D05G096100v1 [Gossypium tomentosum]